MCSEWPWTLTFIRILAKKCKSNFNLYLLLFISLSISEQAFSGKNLFSSVYFFKDLIASVFVQNNFQITFLIRNLQLPPIKSNAYGADLLVWINSKKAIWHVKIFSGFPSWPSTHCAIGLSMHFSVMVMMVPMESATFLLKRVVLDLTEMWSIFVTLSGSWPISDQSKRLPRRTSWILERKSSNVSSGFYQVSQQGSNLKNNLKI